MDPIYIRICILYYIHTSLAGTGGRPMIINIGSNRLFGYEVGLVGYVGSVKLICWWSH